MEYRPTRECERRAELYSELADEARASGDTAGADRLLLLAWAAYDDVDAALDCEEPDTGEICPFRQRGCPPTP